MSFIKQSKLNKVKLKEFYTIPNNAIFERYLTTFPVMEKF